MVGLLHNSHIHTLNQWYKLFTNQDIVRSTEAYAHWQHVKRLGIPTNKNENWKYTPLDSLLKRQFIFPATYTIPSALRDAISLTLDAYRLVFINGRFEPLLSDQDTGQWQIEIEKGAIRRMLPPPIQPEVFLHLTESLCQEITRISLPTRKVAERPLYLLHINHSTQDRDKKALTTLHYRHHIDIEFGAKGEIIEHFTSINSKGYFTGTRTSMTIGNNACLNHIKLTFENNDSYHFSHNDIHIERDAIVHSNTFILGARLTRHQTSTKLNGEGSYLTLNSLLLPSKKDISDSRTYLEHNKGHCFSRQIHKIIVRDYGKGVFNGLIKVAKYAIKTDSKMINNNLLLDNFSKINTQPHLEIYADDVKCSHGATVGQIDEEQLFYLCTRGISHENAQKMIIYAFTAELTEAITNNVVRDTILTRIADTLQKVAI